MTVIRQLTVEEKSRDDNDLEKRSMTEHNSCFIYLIFQDSRWMSKKKQREYCQMSKLFLLRKYLNLCKRNREEPTQEEKQLEVKT